MTISPRFGEVWHAPNATILPGGMLCLIVSTDDYHTVRGQYIIVEVVTERLAGDAIVCDLGTIGVALTGAPFTVDLTWFTGSHEPVATCDHATATRAANQIRAILGP